MTKQVDHLVTVLDAVRALDRFDRDERIAQDLDRVDYLQRIVEDARTSQPRR